MTTTPKVLTTGAIIGIVIGCLLGALYVYCCIISARKAIRDRRAKVVRNLARKKAKAFREHHRNLARKIYDIRGNGKSPEYYPYYIDGANSFGPKISSFNSIDNLQQSYTVFLSNRRRSSSTIPPTEVIPKVTLLPNRKFAITKENASAMAMNNAARPPPGLISGPNGTRFPMTAYPQPPTETGDPIFSGGPMRIPLATREPSLDDSSDLSSEISSFVSGSLYGFYAGPSFRRRNSYEYAMRRTNMPPVVHPLRDMRAQAAAAAAVRTIDRLTEAEAIRRKEIEKEEQIIEDIEGETRATQMDRDSYETLSGIRESIGLSSNDVNPLSNEEDKLGPTGFLTTTTERAHIQCPVWIHPDIPNEGLMNCGYTDYQNYL